MECHDTRMLILRTATAISRRKYFDTMRARLAESQLAPRVWTDVYFETETGVRLLHDGLRLRIDDYFDHAYGEWCHSVHKTRSGSDHELEYEWSFWHDKWHYSRYVWVGDHAISADHDYRNS